MFSLASVPCHIPVHRDTSSVGPSKILQVNKARVDLKIRKILTRVSAVHRLGSKRGPQGWLISGQYQRNWPHYQKPLPRCGFSEDAYLKCAAWFVLCIFDTPWNLPSPVALFEKGFNTQYLPRLVGTEARESGNKNFTGCSGESFSSLMAKHSVIRKASFWLSGSWSNMQFLIFISETWFLFKSFSSNIHTVDRFLTVPLEV